MVSLDAGGCSVEPVNFTQRTWLCIVARLFARLFGLPGNKLEVRGKVVGLDQQDNGLL